MTDEIDQGASENNSSLKIIIEIPKETTGRSIDAITDLIRPISESFGLVGDVIALKRQKTLKKLAILAKERLESLDKPVKEIPSKFFVPLLEKASLEDLNDGSLMNMWANLLVTSATDSVELLGQYISILSEITSEQVQILEDIVRGTEYNPDKADIFVDNFYYLNQTGLPGSLSKFHDIEDVEKFIDLILNEFDINGIALDTLNVFYSDKDLEDSFSISSPDNVYGDAKFYDFENLVRLGLLSKCEVKCHKVGIFDIDVHYYIITPVGIDLYACCNPQTMKREMRVSFRESKNY